MEFSVIQKNYKFYNVHLFYILRRKRKKKRKSDLFLLFYKKDFLFEILDQ